MATSSATTRRIRPANQKIYTQQPALGMTPGPAIFLVFCMRGWAAHRCTQRPAQRRAPGPTMSNHPPGIEPGRSGRRVRAAWPTGKRTLAPPFLRRKDSIVAHIYPRSTFHLALPHGSLSAIWLLAIRLQEHEKKKGYLHAPAYRQPLPGAISGLFRALPRGRYWLLALQAAAS